MRTLATLLISSFAAFAQYKAEAAGAPPAELNPAIAATLHKTGSKILNPDGSVMCEVWLVASNPKASAGPEEASTLAVVQGSLVGAIRFPTKNSDRRGQTIKPGVYTLRYSMYPVNGDHQGAAPQRDFALLTPAGDDSDPAATPTFDVLVGWSRKASGTPHPAVLSIWKQEAADFKPGFAAMGEHDWVLQAKVGDVMLAMILVGRAEG